MEDRLIEAVARAIAAHKRGIASDHPEIANKWQSYCGQARAAMAALAEVRPDVMEIACTAFRKNLIDTGYYAMTMGNVTGRVLEDAMRAALAALAQGGVVMVPVEPTEAMLEAGQLALRSQAAKDAIMRAILAQDERAIAKAKMRHRYRAMLSAAPQGTGQTEG